MTKQEIIPHLFRTEFSRITSVLCKRFGIEHIQEAEDIASETFVSALETWPYHGIPDNPVAWLYKVARNKALNLINRTNHFSEVIAPAVQASAPVARYADIDLSDQNITDSQLQMLFAICHPTLPEEAQIGLALRILCGFGIEEIATAFLTNKETINKRLFRAREKLREQSVKIEFPSGKEIKDRLNPVLRTLYLLFSEGYYSESNDDALRKDLCFEAMRLTRLLIDYDENLPEVKALFSLMCFHASRFDARQNDLGEMVLYEDQDEAQWNKELISTGAYYLHKASVGEVVSNYHIEASIAYWHTVKPDTKEKWESILQLYDVLLDVSPSPTAALNRLVALARVSGHACAITEAEKLQFTNNHYYFTLLGYLYTCIDPAKSRSNFQQALLMARTPTDQKAIKRLMEKRC